MRWKSMCREVSRKSAWSRLFTCKDKTTDKYHKTDVGERQTHKPSVSGPERDILTLKKMFNKINYADFMLLYL